MGEKRFHGTALIAGGISQESSSGIIQPHEFAYSENVDFGRITAGVIQRGGFVAFTASSIAVSGVTVSGVGQCWYSEQHQRDDPI